MAYTTKTLSDLQQSLADRHDSGTVPTKAATLARWNRIFNRAVQYCYRKVKKTKSITVTTSSYTVLLPDDFDSIDRAFNSSGIEFEQIAPQESTQAKSGQMVYWITGNNTGFYFNSPNDNTFTIHYVWRPIPMVNTTDECPFEDEEAIVAYAYGMLRKSESDPFEDADASLAECDRRCVDIQSNQNTNDNYQGFTLQSGS